MSEWTGYPEEDPDLLEEQRAWDEKQAAWSEAQQEAEEREWYYYVCWYYSPEGWLERFYDDFITKYGTDEDRKKRITIPPRKYLKWE